MEQIERTPLGLRTEQDLRNIQRIECPEARSFALTMYGLFEMQPRRGETDITEAEGVLLTELVDEIYAGIRAETDGTTNGATVDLTSAA